MGVMTNPDGPTRIARTSLASIDAQRMRYWLKLRETLERFVVWEVKRVDACWVRVDPHEMVDGFARSEPCHGSPSLRQANGGPFEADYRGCVTVIDSFL